MPNADVTESPLLKHLTGYVNGAFLPATERGLDVRDPADGSVVARLPSYGRPVALRAIESAERALGAPPSLADRRRWLEAVAGAHASHREDLARIITRENGKPLAEARGEVDYAAGFYADAARRVEQLAPRTLEGSVRGHRWRVYCRPAGVAGLIVPWNFPLAMLAKKASAALAAGAPMVVKPAETTPLSSIALFHLLHALDLPKGLVNLVFGDAPAIGQALCTHPAVRVISFTGSTAVGRLLSAQAAPHVKRMALELGGNAPFLVFDDADLEPSADALIANKFRCSGQTCVCTNRVYVQQGIRERFVALVAERVAALKVGPGLSPDSQVGPLINRAGFAKVRELVVDAVRHGARAVVGGAPEVPAEGQPTFYPPTLLDGVSGGARCLREEVFGPVIPMVGFDGEDEVVQAANDTEYGLAAYVFTRSDERAERVLARLSFGHVGWNTAVGPAPEAPFGGMKQSGLGREGGLEGILEMVELQTVPSPA